MGNELKRYFLSPSPLSSILCNLRNDIVEIHCHPSCLLFSWTFEADDHKARKRQENEILAVPIEIIDAPSWLLIHLADSCRLGTKC